MNAKQNTKYAKKKTTNTQKKTPNTPKNTPNTPKKHQLRQKTPNMQKKPNTPKYSKFSFTLFCRKKNFVPNSRTFWCTFYRPKKYGGVTKRTNIRYDLSSEVVLTVEPYSFQFRCKLGIFPENVPICQGKFGSRR